MMEKWYNLKIEDVFSKVNSNEVGLSNKESKKRLEKYGKNELPKKEKDSVIKIFFNEFNYTARPSVAQTMPKTCNCIIIFDNVYYPW